MDAIEGVMEMILNSEYLATYYYTNPNWEDEFNGMTDGSGIENKRIQFFNLIPEATRAACSIYGTWGKAT